MRPLTVKIAVAVWACVLPGLAHSAHAQGRPIQVELVSGHAGYVDDAWDNRVLIGGAIKLALSPRVAIGPELVYQHGFEDTSEVVATGTATINLRDPRTPRRVVPYVVVAAGMSRRRETFERGPYFSNEFNVSAGIGARVPLRAGWYLAGDARLGWEPERRLSAVLGWRARP